METQELAPAVESKKTVKKQKKAIKAELGATNLNKLKGELKKISTAFTNVLSGGVKPEFVVALIHDVTRIKKKEVRKVLETASNLESLFLVPATRKTATAKKATKRKTKKASR